MTIRLQQVQGLLVAALVLLSACSTATSSQPSTTDTASPPNTVVAAVTPSTAPIVADVLSVQASGNPGDYTFSVEVGSPDENCFQYADWWEVVDEQGQPLYRRVLTHSHADEQPFTRSGGPIPIESGITVWVRAHMNIGGYGGVAMHGSVKAGFQPADLSADFAADLANQAPLPQDCAF